MKPQEPLTHNEAKELRMFEKVIAQNPISHADISLALAKIKIGRLYRRTHEKFEKYCEEKFDLSGDYANRLVKAAVIFHPQFAGGAMN